MAEKALTLASSGQKSIAYNEFSQNAVPLIMDVNDSLNELAEYKSKKADEAKDKAISGSDIAKRMIIVITIAALIVSVTVGLIVSRIITNPLREIVNRIQQVAEGNLALDKVKVNSKDEVGQLGVAINTMLENSRRKR